MTGTLSSELETSTELDFHDYSRRKSQLSRKLEPISTCMLKNLHYHLCRIGQSGARFFFFFFSILEHSLPETQIPFACAGCRKPNTKLLSQDPPEYSIDAETKTEAERRKMIRIFAFPGTLGFSSHLTDSEEFILSAECSVLFSLF